MNTSAKIHDFSASRNSERDFSDKKNQKAETRPLTKEEKFIDKCLRAYLEKDNPLSPNFEYKPNFRASKDILNFFKAKNRIAAGRLYLLIRKHFSGKIKRNQLKQLAKIAGKKESYIYNLIKDLLSPDLRMIERSGEWFFIVGTKRFNIREGIMHNHMVEVPDNALKDVKTFRNFCYSSKMTEASRKASALQGAKSSAPVYNPELSAGFMVDFIGVSERTIFRQKKQAKKNKFMAFRKQHKIIAHGSPELIPQWFELHPHPERCFLKRRKPMIWAMCERTPSRVAATLIMKKRKHRYSKDEKALIKAHFVKLDLIPAKKSNNSSIKISDTHQERELFLV